MRYRLSCRTVMTFAASLAVAGPLAPPASAARKPQPAWQVLRATDPVTLASTCAVVATDFVGRTRFTRTGALYPVVEMNGKWGLLVGVSSGGRIRMPTGDIVWSVDGRPYREIKAADNPGAPRMPATGTDAAADMEAMTAWAMQLARSGIATSTLASGAKAREMLDEMLQGHSLLFRQAGAGQQTGLPDYQALMAGQVNARGELNPIPLDASFHEALTACGIK
jgi:hypothetical protein